MRLGPPTRTRGGIRLLLLPLLVLLLLLTCSSLVASVATSSRVQALLATLSLEEKVGQMLQLDLLSFLNPGTLELNTTRLAQTLREYHVGSILNSPFTLGPAGGKDGWTAADWKQLIRSIHETAQDVGAIPPLYGIDSVHGANYVLGATLFPQQINAAASFSRDLVWSMGRIQAKDTKAAGIPWLFAPILGINTQPLWSRSFETFGECPFVAAEMGQAIIRGMQTEKDPAFPNFPPAAACMKHFIAYPAAVTGHDRSPIELDQRTVLQLYAPSFRAAVQAGVKSAMEAYTEVAGVPMASSKEYLVDLLRDDMGFDGMLVTDYNEIANLHQFHYVAEDMEGAVALAMKDTSIDMSMNPPLRTEFADAVINLVKTGKVPEARVDASVSRILALKEWLGLLDDPLHLLNDFPEVEASVGSEADQQVALALARESIVLLENQQDLLPLQPRKLLGKKILVTGQGCHSLGMQSGGWTLHWQGAHRNGIFTHGKTFYEGIRERFPMSEVWYHPGVTVDGTDVPGQAEVLHHAKHADLIVACVGEHTYAEKPGDTNDLALPNGQVEFIETLTKVGPPVVAVLVEGRARVVGTALDKAAAVLNAMLVGPSGGQALAEILVGDVNPSARLPFTYPRFTGVAPLQYYRKPSSLCTTGRVIQPFTYIDCPRQWDFGQGLSYTTFVYSNVSLSASTVDEHTPLEVSVTVTNTGLRVGKEVVMLFLTDKVRRVTPEYKLLKGFEKIELSPKESRTVSFTLHPQEDFSFIGVERRRELESGLFFIGFGPEADCRARPEECASFTLTLSTKYDIVCEAACVAWGKIGKSEEGEETLPATLSAAQCHDTCLAHRKQNPESWSWDYVRCLERQMKGDSSHHYTWRDLATACYNPFLSTFACPLSFMSAMRNGTDDSNDEDSGSSTSSSSSNNAAEWDVDVGTLASFVLITILLVVAIVCGVIRLGRFMINDGGWSRVAMPRPGSASSGRGRSSSSNRGMPLLNVYEVEGHESEEQQQEVLLQQQQQQEEEGRGQGGTQASFL